MLKTTCQRTICVLDGEENQDDNDNQPLMRPVEDNAVNDDNDPPVVVNDGNVPEVQNEEELVDPMLDDGPGVEVPIICADGFFVNTGDTTYQLPIR
jgi:hypothetical protein